ncbi:hypothetical protein LVJ94_02215 [Pendulispora rubella]|uniref:Uncharacterized protein n=1 Tax=Pendulispora rubella TaxID=2741070 RepID=A0ABZ2L5P8_9BACT
MNAGWLAASAVALLALSCGGHSDSERATQSSTHELTEEEDSFRTHCSDRTQFGGDATHQNRTCVVGQDLKKTISSAVYDPFVAQEVAEQPNGGLLVHYPMPLTRRNQLFMSRKSGRFVPCDPPGSGQPAPCGLQNTEFIHWNMVGYDNDDGQLSERWTFTSDWKPFSVLGGRAFEQVFQSALGRRVLFVPGLGGTVHVLDPKHGRVLARLNPFGSDVDPAYHIASPLTVDDDDNLYYNVLKADPDRRLTQALLVRIGANGRSRVVDYTALTPGAPAPTDKCRGTYVRPRDPLPWPLMDANGAVVPPTPVTCLGQAPPIDMAPALSADGRTLYTGSRAVGDRNYAYFIAVRTSDLSLRWSRSLRGLVHDGCGVINHYESDPTEMSPCRNGAPLGLDRTTGDEPAGAFVDGDTSSPVVLPDGKLLLGTISNYNYSRGHLFTFTSDGEYLSNFDFGWDVTPAIWRHDGTYSIISKDNHYFENYLSTGMWGPFLLPQLDANLKLEWNAKNTETKKCKRDASGNVVCVEDPEHAGGFEWCVNAPAVDVRGTVFVTSEDGHTYQIEQGGRIVNRQFLDQALGSAYTPAILDRHGHTIALNAGIMTVLGAD